jgi:dTDP-4-dehydrorhamnose reductase
MLGHQLCVTLADRVDLWGTFRHDPVKRDGSDILPKERVIRQYEALDLARTREILDNVKPDAVINAIGIVKQRDEAKQAVPSIQVNALFPHQLADMCVERGVRVIQISTDCVFSGSRGNYSEGDIPDPIDLYGRTKLLGELNRPGCLTIRTSIIGWQLNTFTSLLSWFALQRGKSIKGYRRAIYSGLSTYVLSSLIGDIIKNHSDLQGLYQIASTPITKYDLLMQLRDALGWSDISIESDDSYACDRSLNGRRFNDATGWCAPAWDAMIIGLAKEWPTYEKWYTPHIRS